MPSIDYYYMPESPLCRTVELVANIAGVSLNKHYINLFEKDQLKDEFIKLNPLHRVPFIVDGDLKMGESRAIMAYICNRYMTDDTLYPRDPVKRALVDELLSIEYCHFFPAMSKLFRPIMFGLSKELNTDDEKELRVILEYFDKRLESNGSNDLKYLMSNEITIADITVAVSMTMLEANSYDFTSFKFLTSYYNNLKAHIPKFSEVNDKPLENLKKFIKDNQEKPFNFTP